jgi:choice-of-anchor A domain-containing protein
MREKRGLFMLRAAISVCVVLAAGGVASAGTFSDWNLLVRKDLSNMTSHVDGSALIGGNLSGSGSVFSMHQVSASNGAGLMVGGNVTGSHQVNQGGDFVYGGTNSGSVLTNGGGSAQQQVGIGATVSAAFAHAGAYSSFLRDLAPTGTLTLLDGTKGKLNSASTVGIGSDQYAVYSLNASNINAMSELDLNFGSADFVVINVDASSLVMDMNFIGGMNQNNSDRIVWNFFNATDLDITHNLSGMVLATLADVNISGSGMYGSLIADSISGISAEVRLKTFSGDFDIPAVPLPPAAWAGLATLGGIFGVRAVRRR